MKRNVLPVLLIVLVLTIIVLAVGAGVAMWISGGMSWWAKPVAGVLTYQIDPHPTSDGPDVDMQRLVAIVDKRVNPGWVERGQVRLLDDERIEITVFGGGPRVVSRIERLVESAGTLEFRVLASTQERSDSSIIDRARKESGHSVTDADGKAKALWVPIMPGGRPEDVKRMQLLAGYPDAVLRTVDRGGQEVSEVLVLIDVFNVTGQYLERAMHGFDAAERICVDFALTRRGGKLFAGLTGGNLPDPVQPDRTRKLGIILDGALYSAPSIRTVIHDRAQITGTFTAPEVRDLVDVLNAGPLPAPLKKTGPRRPPP